MAQQVLEKINSLSDVNLLNEKELQTLSEELRSEILNIAYENGGHLASSLGAVDCITALCNVYNFDKDKLFFDVGHQSYAYKILARGKENFATLRQEGGESGFPDREKGDSFIGGHAGNSLSAALGMADARDKLGEKYNIVTFIGDASFFNGENMEGLLVNNKKPENFIVIFNDNGMSISKNENGMYKFFSKISLRKGYRRTKNLFKKILGDSFIAKGLGNWKSAFKRSLTPAAAIENSGFKYYGAFDGHDIKTMCNLLEEIKERGKPAFIHLRTTKGKGYKPAEEKAEQFHGVSKGLKTSSNSFSDAISSILSEEVKKDNRVVAITAGMRTGTGLSEFSVCHPDNFVDVGISEEHAVTYAAGLACGGLKPVVLLYSTFLQRAYDQILSDVAMQKLPVLFLIDRAGVVGADGKTHQGLFDLSYLKTIPGIVVLSPKDTNELKEMVDYSLKGNCPVAIRYPSGDNQPIEGHLPFNGFGKWEVIEDGKDVSILAVGARMVKLAKDFKNNNKNIDIKIINARSIKPLDEEMLLEISDMPIITMEENVRNGGFGEGVVSFYSKNHIDSKVEIMAVKDEFINQATVKRQLEMCGLCEDSLKDSIKKLGF